MVRTITDAARKTLIIGIVALAAFGIAACASAPPPAAQKTAPGWTLQTPAPDGTYTYFVGYAGAPSGQTARATDDATNMLISEIVRYMGVTVTSESTATAKATLDSFQADMVQTVSSSATGRISGFQVVEKYVAEGRDDITVYILSRYITKDLEKEKNRIAAAFQEKFDAVAIPEAEGKELLASGDFIGATRKFIEAAAAASGSDVDNADIKFERNINAAKGAVAKIGIEKLTDRLQTSSGVPFPAKFQAKASADGRGLKGVPVIVTHQTKLANGKMSTKNASLTSDADGYIDFDHPTPNFVGKFNLTIRLDLSSATEPLFDVPSKYQSMVAGLEDEISGKRVSIEYEIISMARDIPTSVLIVDIDSWGGASIGTTTSALLQTLSGNGFKVKAAPLAPDVVMSRNDTAIFEVAQASLPDAERFAYGTTRILSVKDDKTQKIVTVSAEIKVVELATGRLLYSSVKQVPAVASSEEEAADAARRQLGQKTIGEDLAASLP